MSRAPPFPTRRRSPSVTNGMPSLTPGTSTTRPLQISRPGSQPTTPANAITSSSPSYPPPNTAPLGPSRPQRSELRARADYSESERASISSLDPYRDNASASLRSEIFSTSYRTVAPNSANTVSKITDSRSKLQRLEHISTNGDQLVSPSLNSALSAFRSAGSRKGQTPSDEVTVDDDYYKYQRDREIEIEAEMARQQRIRDNGLGFRTKGNARRGEIDGMLFTSVLEPGPNHVSSRSRSGEGRMGVCN